MNPNFLEFEQPIGELEAKIEELRHVTSETEVNIGEEIARLEVKSRELTEYIFKDLSSWQIAQLARHPLRPHSKDYIHRIFSDFDELHGDRVFADDHALMAGIGRLGDRPVMIIGQQKGRDTKEKIKRNFGMMHPEGYRRANRLLKMAEKFKLPVITLIDTPGAYPGIDAEARGQSEAIAQNLFLMAGLKTPVVCAVIGEGASGGALGIGVGDRVLMLQYSFYATISPEGCASILFRSAERAAEAAETMGITADILLQRGLIDGIVPEPLGGAHRNVEEMANALKQALIENLQALENLSHEELILHRQERLLAIGHS